MISVGLCYNYKFQIIYVQYIYTKLTLFLHFILGRDINATTSDRRPVYYTPTVLYVFKYIFIYIFIYIVLKTSE